VSPNPVRNRDFSKSLAKRLRVLHWLPAVPSWILKLTMGKMATLLLISQKISSVKIQQTGFEFQFATLSESLKHHIE
jgi:NAD dependent epimerase/dehydratase family enzyme